MHAYNYELAEHLSNTRTVLQCTVGAFSSKRELTFFDTTLTIVE